MNGHIVKIRKDENGNERIFLDDQELKNVVSYSFVASNVEGKEKKTIFLEFKDIQGIIIE